MKNFLDSRAARLALVVLCIGAVGSFSALLSPRGVGAASTTFATPADNASSTLGDDYTAGSGTVTLASGYGATLAAKLSALGYPAISSSAPIRFTLTAGGLAQRAKTSVFKATSLSGDVLGGVTVETGSTDQDFVAGDLWQVLVTSRSLYTIQSAINALELGTSGTVDAIGTVGASTTLNIAAGALHTITSTASTAMTITPSGAGTAGQRMWILIRSDASGGDVVTFAAPFKANGTLTLTASKGHTLQFVSDGTNWWEVSRTSGL